MWILEFIGAMIFAFGIVTLMIIHEKDLKTFIIVVIMALNFILTSWFDREEGEPKTSIETGDYSIVSYAETMSGDESMYQMILEQNNKIEFYALSKSMVTIDKNNGKPGTLEVIEKAGSKKAIMRP